MNVQVENLEKNMAKLTVTVDAAELEKAITKAYNKQKNSISVPGFRKGKVPQHMIEKMYGAEIFYEDAANIIMQDTYPAAYDELSLISYHSLRLTSHSLKRVRISSTQQKLLLSQKLSLVSTRVYL